VTPGTDYTTSYGLPEPDWELMDPVTGDDIAAFHQLSERVAAEQRAQERQGDPTAAVWMERDCPDGLSWRECRNNDCGPRVDGRGCLIEPPAHSPLEHSRED
jgi:hypothetical protein